MLPVFKSINTLASPDFSDSRVYRLRVHAVLLLGLGLGLELAASSVVSFSMYPRLGRGLAANFSENVGRRAPSSHDGPETPREKGTRNQIIHMIYPRQIS
jgi:hypothetical protein